MGVKVPAPLVLTLSYLGAAVSAGLGWLTLGQVALSIAIELLVALHYAGRRIVHAEGVVGHVDPLYQPSNGVRPVAGQPLDAADRALVSQNERKWLSVICVIAGGALVLGAGDSLVSSPFELLVWAALTGSLVLGERQRFTGWLGSDAPRTADPTTQTAHVTFRIVAFAGVLLFGASVIGASSTAGALLLLGTSWLIDLIQELPRGSGDASPGVDAEDRPETP